VRETSFLESLKRGFYSLGDRFRAFGSDMGKVVRNNELILKANDHLTQVNKEAIASLKEYAIKQDPQLEKDFKFVSEILDSIENNRSIMVEQLRQEYIRPLSDLFQEWKTLDKKEAEIDSIERQYEKIRTDIERKKLIPEDQRKPGDIESLQRDMEESNAAFLKKKEELEPFKRIFNEKSVETLRLSAKSLIQIMDTFYSKSASLFNEEKALLPKTEVKKAI